MTEKAAANKQPTVSDSLQTTFTAMYRQELAYVWKVLGRLGAQRRDTEDLAHEVFVTAFKQFKHYDPARPLKPWLFGIAYRVVLGHKRKHQNHREDLSDNITATDTQPNAEQTLSQTQGLRLAAKALEALELERRSVFVLHEIDGCPIPEVAEALGIGLNTAYSRLRLARRDFNAAAATLQLPARGAP